mmetsp:Transcript_4630/g.12327  ORF Transcript_4630/g.12327 Transcript_4630/m.12327 type:complete len:297 (+) Transcript_4630:297-1187(+)
MNASFFEHSPSSLNSAQRGCQSRHSLTCCFGRAATLTMGVEAATPTTCTPLCAVVECFAGSSACACVAGDWSTSSDAPALISTCSRSQDPRPPVVAGADPAAAMYSAACSLLQSLQLNLQVCAMYFAFLLHSPIAAHPGQVLCSSRQRFKVPFTSCFAPVGAAASCKEGCCSGCCCTSGDGGCFDCHGAAATSAAAANTHARTIAAATMARSADSACDACCLSWHVTGSNGNGAVRLPDLFLMTGPGGRDADRATGTETAVGTLPSSAQPATLRRYFMATGVRNVQPFARAIDTLP